jgi:hypothetical protein
LESLLASHNLHIVVLFLSTTSTAQHRPKRALFLLLALPSLSLPESVLLPVRRILPALRPVPAIMPLAPHLCRDLAAHAFNTESLNQRIHTIPRVQSVQVRFGPSRRARAWSRAAPCLCLVIVAVIAGFLDSSIIVFYDCDKAAFAGEGSATWAAGVGDASASCGRVLRVIATHESFWSSAGERVGRHWRECCQVREWKEGHTVVDWW